VQNCTSGTQLCLSAAAAAASAAAGVRNADIERPVAGNPTVYGINTAVLALAAGFAAASPQFVSPGIEGFLMHSHRRIPRLRQILGILLCLTTQLLR
jgi:hypothetical protein